MRLGINCSSLLVTGASLDELCRHAQEADAQGFSSYWVGQLALPDALTLIAAIGGRTGQIELGTSVVPTWARHPLMLAGQALTVQEAIGNRLALGLGLGHKELIESSLKVEWKRPARHMEEYLDVLGPALTERRVSATGDIWSGEGDLSGAARAASAPPVLIAAMGPRMLALAGGRSDGVILWLAGARTVADVVVPALAAERNGGPAPRIVAGLPVCVTAEPDRVRATIAHVLGHFAQFDSYRRVLELEGVSGPAEVALVGTAGEVRAGLRALADAGATDFAATEFVTSDSEAAATRDLLREVAAG